MFGSIELQNQRLPVLCTTRQAAEQLGLISAGSDTPEASPNVMITGSKPIETQTSHKKMQIHCDRFLVNLGYQFGCQAFWFHGFPIHLLGLIEAFAITEPPHSHHQSCQAKHCSWQGWALSHTLPLEEFSHQNTSQIILKMSVFFVDGILWNSWSCFWHCRHLLSKPMGWQVPKAARLLSSKDLYIASCQMGRNGPTVLLMSNPFTKSLTKSRTKTY